MSTKNILKILLISFIICSSVHRAEAEIDKRNFKQINLTYIDLVLKDVERDIEKHTIRRAIFFGKENINFLLSEDIALIDKNGYKILYLEDADRIGVDFSIPNYQRFKKKSQNEQRKLMMDKVKEVEGLLMSNAMLGFELNRDLKVRFIAPQEKKQDYDILGDTLVATYNEGKLIFVNRTLRDIFEQERKLKKIK